MAHDPWAPIHVACVNNDPEALSRELEDCVSPNLREGGYSSRYRTPLCLVLEHARDPDVAASCISLLLNAGAWPSGIDPKKQQAETDDEGWSMAVVAMAAVIGLQVVAGAVAQDPNQPPPTVLNYND